MSYITEVTQGVNFFLTVTHCLIAKTFGANKELISVLEVLTGQIMPLVWVPPCMNLDTALI